MITDIEPAMTPEQADGVIDHLVGRIRQDVRAMRAKPILPHAAIDVHNAEIRALEGLRGVRPFREQDAHTIATLGHQYFFSQRLAIASLLHDRSRPFWRVRRWWRRATGGR